MDKRTDDKFIELFGKSPDDCLSYLSTARAKMVYRYQKAAFSLGFEVGAKWGVEEKERLDIEADVLEQQERLRSGQ